MNVYFEVFMVVVIELDVSNYSHGCFIMLKWSMHKVNTNPTL